MPQFLQENFSINSLIGPQLFVQALEYDQVELMGPTGVALQVPIQITCERLRNMADISNFQRKAIFYFILFFIVFQQYYLLPAISKVLEKVTEQLKSHFDKQNLLHPMQFVPVPGSCSISPPPSSVPQSLSVFSARLCPLCLQLLSLSLYNVYIRVIPAHTMCIHTPTTPLQLCHPFLSEWLLAQSLLLPGNLSNDSGLISRLPV